MIQETGFSIINLREAGEVRLLFPQEIKTDDRSNWQDADVAGGLKPLFFANTEPQRISVDELMIDYTRTNASVEGEIETLRSWMRPQNNQSSPPPLLVLTKDWQARCVLTEMNVKRSFFTKEGVCVRAYLSLSFEEIRVARAELTRPRLVRPRIVANPI
jgi:hypothetical protein